MSVVSIVHLIGGLQRGGAEKQLVLHALGQAELGNEVIVLTVMDGPRADDLRRAGIEVRVMPRGDPPHGLRWAVRAALWVYREVRRIRPQVLHAFLPQPNLLAAIVGRLCKVPVVVMGRRSLGHYHAAHPWIDRGELFLTRLATCVIANSEAIADQIVARREIAAGRVYVVPNAIEPAWSRHRLDQGVPTLWRFVTVANLRPVKGLPVLIEALDLLHSRGVSFVWTLVGDGPQRGLLDRAARERPWMTLAGGLDPEEVCARLDAADIYVGSSLSEGMSNAVMEAMARGLPAVVTDVGGTRSVVGEAGLLVPPGRADLLARDLLRLITSPELWRRCRAATEAQARTYPTPLAVAERLDRIYRSYL